MAALQSNSLNLPGTYLGIVEGAANTAGVLAKLSPDRPTRFGAVKGAMFNGTPRAQIVGESEAKSSTDISKTPFSADPVKFQISLRVSDEFVWGDDDYRLEEMDNVSQKIGEGMGRAVDLIAIHGVNPASGTVSPKVTRYLSQTTNVATLGASPTDAVTAAAGLVIGDGYVPTGVALDGAFGFAVATEKYTDGRDRNPGMGFGQALTNLAGMNAATGSTVSGLPEIAADTKIRAVLGDYGKLRWGYQRDLPIEIIKYGDPDNTGRDLAGHNEVLLRAEAVIYVAIPDLNAFSLVKAA